MKNEFFECAQKLELSDLLEVESRLGISLPDDFKDHYLEYNGGVPQRSCWEYMEGEYYEIADFKPIKYSSSDEESLSIYDTVEGTYTKYLEDKLIDKDYLPFANDWGGNYFCINLKNNNIIFYAMDTDVKPIKILTNGFTNFLENLVRCEDEED